MFLSKQFGLISIVLAVLLCRAVLSIFVHAASISKEEKDCPTWGIYVRRACERA